MSTKRIQYTQGNATSVEHRPAVIVHICNDVGAWGLGFVLAVSKRWLEPEQNYRAWASSGEADFRLGAVRFVEIERGLWVANMIAQRDIRRHNGLPPVRYDALRSCLRQVGHFCKNSSANVHMPRIGCGLAGGEWNEVALLIEETLCRIGVDVTVYDLPVERAQASKCAPLKVPTNCEL